MSKRSSNSSGGNKRRRVSHEDDHDEVSTQLTLDEESRQDLLVENAELQEEIKELRAKIKQDRSKYIDIVQGVTNEITLLKNLVASTEVEAKRILEEYQSEDFSWKYQDGESECEGEVTIDSDEEEEFEIDADEASEIARVTEMKLWSTNFSKLQLASIPQDQLKFRIKRFLESGEARLKMLENYLDSEGTLFYGNPKIPSHLRIEFPNGPDLPYLNQQFERFLAKYRKFKKIKQGAKTILRPVWAFRKLLNSMCCRILGHDYTRLSKESNLLETEKNLKNTLNSFYGSLKDKITREVKNLRKKNEAGVEDSVQPSIPDHLGHQRQLPRTPYLFNTQMHLPHPHSELMAAAHLQQQAAAQAHHFMQHSSHSHMLGHGSL